MTVSEVEVQNWTRKQAFVVQGTAAINHCTPKYVTRVDGIPLTDCRNLQKQFGQDFPSRIGADPAILAKTRYSKEKKGVIVRACQLEAIAAAKNPSAKLDIVAKLCACGLTKHKARRLAEDFNPDGTPYQLFLGGGLTYRQADNFAQLVDPERAAEDRPFLFVVDQFINAPHVILPERDIREVVYTNFGANAGDGLGRLVDLGIVRKVEKQVSASGDAASGEVGERVVFFYDNSRKFGTVTEEAEPLSQSATVTFDDGLVLKVNPKYLRKETTATQTWFGLARFVEAEETIAALLSDNPPTNYTDAELAEIEWVIDHSAEVLNRPGFIPNEEQKQAVRQAFRYKNTIVTGPPGVGKTAVVVALINACAARLFPDDPSPVLGVALAGRAASVMRSAAVFWRDGFPVAMDSSTIHRAMKLTSTDDDTFITYGRINCRVLVSDETSMDSSPLLAALLEHTTASHIVFVGDERQLQPIGVGSPLRDMIASGVIPTAHLTQNYRANCLGILALCDDIRNGTISVDKLSKYLKLGGVYYVPCEYRARPYMVAQHYADLVAKGISPNDIRVLSPHNTGGTGTQAINIEVRKELDLSSDELVVGDILLITENDYQAVCCPGYPQVTKETVGYETIFNGELCWIINVGRDLIDVEFEENCDGVRHVRLICPDGDDASARLTAQTEPFTHGLLEFRNLAIHVRRPKCCASRFWAV